jgi:hypothetical protein
MGDKQPPDLGSASSTLAPKGGHSEPVAEAPESPTCQGFGGRAQFTEIERRALLAAGHLRFVGATGGPSGAGALDCLFDSDWRHGVWARRIGHRLFESCRK